MSGSLLRFQKPFFTSLSIGSTRFPSGQEAMMARFLSCFVSFFLVLHSGRVGGLGPSASGSIHEYHPDLFFNKGLYSPLQPKQLAVASTRTVPVSATRTPPTTPTTRTTTRGASIITQRQQTPSTTRSTVRPNSIALTTVTSARITPPTTSRTQPNVTATGGIRDSIRATTAPRTCQSGDVTTQANGRDRLNWFPNAGVDKTKTISQKWTVTLNEGEQFYAQPLIHCGVMVVVGMQNNIYVLDAKTGALITKRNLGLPFDMTKDGQGCADVLPVVGLLATPVIDPATNTLYVSYKTYAPGTTSGFRNAWYMMHAMDVFTLEPRAGFPIAYKGTKFGKTFNPSFQMQRPGLLLLDGKIYAGFASHCDLNQFLGWIFKIDAKTGNIDDMFVSTGNLTNSLGAGVWQSGTGLSSDRSGRLFANLGNAFGNSDLKGPRPGSNPPQTLTQAAINLNVTSMTVTDFFIPNNNEYLDSIDLDFGTTGMSILPSDFTTSKFPNVGVAAGKEGFVYLFDLNNLGGYRQDNGNDAVLQKLRLKGQLWPLSVFPPERLVTVVPMNGPVHVLRQTVNATTNQPRLEIFATSADTFQFGTQSMYTSSGRQSGTGALWVPHRSRSLLYVFDTVPNAAGILPVIAQLRTDPTTKFGSPVAANGLVYVATFTGKVFAFGN